MAVDEQSAAQFAEKMRVMRLGLNDGERAAFDATLRGLETQVKMAAAQPDADDAVVALNERLNALPADRADDGESTWVTVTTAVTVTTSSRYLCD